MVFKIRPFASGGHIAVTFYSAKASNETFANIGQLVMDGDDWDAMFVIFQYLEHVIIDPPGNSQELRQGWKIIQGPFDDDASVQILKDSHM